MYDNFIFDLYGTLVDIRTDEESPTVWKKLSLYYGYQGALYAAKELKERYHWLTGEALLKKQASDSVQYAHESFPEIVIEDVFEALYKEKGVEASDELVLNTAQWFRVITTKKLRTYPYVKKFLQKLKDNGKKVYLLSNAQRAFTEYELNYLDISKYFDGILISSNEGVKKPDKAFFMRLKEVYGIDFKKSIMIGNDAASDIGGAKGVGMDAFYIRSNISPANDITPDCKFTLESMDIKKAANKLGLTI